MRLRLLALLGATCLLVAGAHAGPAVAADPTITISGTVLDDDGVGLGGVDVEAIDSDNAETFTVTDAAGHYEVTVQLSGFRSYELWFSKDGGWITRGASASGRPGRNLTDVDVQLVRYGSIRGAVTSPTGSVEDVDVNLFKQDVGENDTVQTAADGSYRFDQVVPGRYLVTFEDFGFDRSYGPDDRSAVEYVDIASGQDVVLRTIAPLPPRPPTPTGTIVADLTGTQRQYPEVTAISLDGTLARAEQLYLGLDRPMVATLGELPAGQYKVALGGRTTWFGGLSLASATPVTVVAGKTTTITAQPGREMWAWGTVVNANGDRLRGVNVELLRSDSPGEVVADLDASRGGFYLEDLPVADYSIRVTDPTGAYATKTFDLPPEPESEDEYVLDRVTPLGPVYPGPATASASGTHTGYRIPGTVCFVPTSGRGGDEMACGEFDSETHRYDILAIKPGDYKVRGGGDADDTERLTWLGGRSFASATTVSVAPGEHKDLDVPGRPDTAILLGHVTGRADVPMPAITILAYAADDPDELIASAYTATGRWDLESVPARPYKLRLVDPTGRYAGTWLGGSSFATATTVTPRLGYVERMPDVTLEPRFGVLAPPIVSGDGYVGDRLAATTGFWTATGLSFTYQWLRDGSPVAGADTAAYPVTSADLGHRLSVRVEGRDGSGNRATTTSSPSYRVTRRPTPEATPPAADPLAPRARPRVSTSVKVLGGGRVRLTVRYSGKGATPTGRVTVRRGSKTVVSWHRLTGGRFSVTLRHQPKGRRRYTVRYSGSDRFVPDARQTARVRVR